MKAVYSIWISPKLEQTAFHWNGEAKREASSSWPSLMLLFTSSCCFTPTSAEQRTISGKLRRSKSKFGGGPRQSGELEKWTSALRSYRIKATFFLMASSPLSVDAAVGPCGVSRLMVAKKPSSNRLAVYKRKEISLIIGLTHSKRPHSTDLNEFMIFAGDVDTVRAQRHRLLEVAWKWETAKVIEQRRKRAATRGRRCWCSCSLQGATVVWFLAIERRSWFDHRSARLNWLLLVYRSWWRGDMAESEPGRNERRYGQLAAASHVGRVCRVLEQITQLLAVIWHGGLVNLPSACPQFNHFKQRNARNGVQRLVHAALAEANKNSIQQIWNIEKHTFNFIQWHI